jgi:hypothetical protein
VETGAIGTASPARHSYFRIEHDEWPSQHTPRAILADRQELMSAWLGRPIVHSLRIQIENTSQDRAALNGILERRFGVVPAIFKQFTPGYRQAGLRD